MKYRSNVFPVVFAALMAALANLLGFFAVPGPWNIKFGLTAIPILISSFVLGPTWGCLTGLFGGIAQGVNYGSIWYVLYTAIQGGVAGVFAKHLRITKWLSPVMGLLGGFFLVWWVDLLRAGQQTFSDLTSTSAPKLFAMHRVTGIPYIGLIGAVLLMVIFIVLAATARPNSIRHLALAGCFAAIAYVPYDALILYKVQDYPWIPTWFVLSKDLIQDFFAAFLCAWVYTTPRIATLLGNRAQDNNTRSAN